MKFPFAVNEETMLDDFGMPAQLATMPVPGGRWYKAWFMDGSIKEWIMKGKRDDKSGSNL